MDDESEKFLWIESSDEKNVYKKNTVQKLYRWRKDWKSYKIGLCLYAVH